MFRSKMYKFASMVLLLAVLGGCSRSKATVDEVAKEIKATEDVSQSDTVIEMDDVILRVGDFDVDYREVLFYIYQAKQRYEKSFNSDIWKVVTEKGETFGEYAKEELLRDITELKVIGTEAEKEKISLTKEEAAKAENAAKNFFDSVPEEDREQYGMEEEKLKAIYMENALAQKVYELKATGTEPSESDKTFEEAYKTWSEGIAIDMSVGLWKIIQI